MAELVGIIMGDGGISNPWQLVISMNSISDLHYSYYVTSLIKDLFQVNVFIRKRRYENTLNLVVTSTTMVDFLVSKGAVRGNKIKQNMDMPQWICNNPEYKKAFIRGLMDTDGCLYIHEHTVGGRTYRNLGLCFTSYSVNLIRLFYRVMTDFGIKAYIPKDCVHVYLYSYKAVLKYLSTFGSSNPRITRKYKEWRGV